MNLTDIHINFENESRQLFVGETILSVTYGEVKYFSEEFENLDELKPPANKLVVYRIELNILVPSAQKLKNLRPLVSRSTTWWASVNFKDSVFEPYVK